MSKVRDSSAVCAVDSAQPCDELSLLQTPTVLKTSYRTNDASRTSEYHNSMLDPDHYVFKLKFEEPENFLELVISHLSRFLHLPGDELEMFRCSALNETKTITNKGPKKSWSFMKKKEQKEMIFGSPLTEDSLVQIQHLMDYLSTHLEVEGLFRKPGNSHRLQQLRAALNTGVCVDLASSRFHSHDVASILKAFLGELAEPVLLHKYFNAHLQIADMMTFDASGNLTKTPDKAKRIETLQLLLLLLPTVNRTLLRGVLNLLFQTAKNQKSNKMNAANLATMFCPHLLWPRNLKTMDFQNNIGKLNDHMAFMIRHSQKIFIAPQYIRDTAQINFTGSSSSVQNNPNYIYTPSGAVKRTSSGRDEYAVETRSYTEKALKELFEQVNNMPDSAKKKRIVKNMEKQQRATPKKNHKRSRTFGGMIKRKVLAVKTPATKVDSDDTSKVRSQSVFHLAQPASAVVPRTQPVLMRRKSANFKKTERGVKESFFRRSMKQESRISKVIASSDDSIDKVALPSMMPIPFPTLDDSEEKENNVRESTV